MDYKDMQHGRDETTVDANDAAEMESLHQQWKQYSHEQIKEAIKKYGPNREDIEAYLSKHGKAE